MFLLHGNQFAVNMHNNRKIQEVSSLSALPTVLPLNARSFVRIQIGHHQHPLPICLQFGKNQKQEKQKVDIRHQERQLFQCAAKGKSEKHTVLTFGQIDDVKVIANLHHYHSTSCIF